MLEIWNSALQVVDSVKSSLPNIFITVVGIVVEAEALITPLPASVGVKVVLLALVPELRKL